MIFAGTAGGIDSQLRMISEIVTDQDESVIMFKSLFKSRGQRDKEAYELAMADAIQGFPVLACKWQYFCRTYVFNAEVPLAERIRAFSFPASRWAYNAYPSLTKTNPLPWMLMLFAAVRSTRTHSSEQLEAAMAAFAEETDLPVGTLVSILPSMVPARKRSTCTQRI